jgi:hypothetical protein
MSGKRKTISTEEFDRRVDAGEDIFDIVGTENIKIVLNHEVSAGARHRGRVYTLHWVVSGRSTAS